MSYNVANKRQRTPKWTIKMDNPEKPAIQVTPDKETTYTSSKHVGML